jgi:hypothetical protein
MHWQVRVCQMNWGLVLRWGCWLRWAQLLRAWAWRRAAREGLRAWRLLRGAPGVAQTRAAVVKPRELEGAELMRAQVQQELAAVALALEVAGPGLEEEVRAQVAEEQKSEGAAQVLAVQVLGRVATQLVQAGQALEGVARVKAVWAQAEVLAQVAPLAPESAPRAHESGCRARHSRWQLRVLAQDPVRARGRACVRA